MDLNRILTFRTNALFATFIIVSCGKQPLPSPKNGADTQQNLEYQQPYVDPSIPQTDMNSQFIYPTDPYSNQNSTPGYIPPPASTNNFNNSSNNGIFGGLFGNLFPNLFNNNTNNNFQNHNTQPTLPNNNSPSVTPSTGFTSPSCSFQFDVGLTQAKIVEYTNSFRSQYSLSPLQKAANLENLAYDWSKIMASQNRMYHRPNLMGSISGYSSVGENVAYYSGYSTKTPESIARQLVDMWISSPGHNANMRRDWSSMGAGVFCIGNSVYGTQNFGK